MAYLGTDGLSRVAHIRRVKNKIGSLDNDWLHHPIRHLSDVLTDRKRYTSKLQVELLSSTQFHQSRTKNWNTVTQNVIVTGANKYCVSIHNAMVSLFTPPISAITLILFAVGVQVTISIAKYRDAAVSVWIGTKLWNIQTTTVAIVGTIINFPNATAKFGAHRKSSGIDLTPWVSVDPSIIMLICLHRQQSNFMSQSREQRKIIVSIDSPE